ncbi:NACHT domain-containing protein [Bacillus rubiinfantis]|uniref:NACHT domain-containing protein n=1 Tax=Bacillus rubiinfantis TaxID=1499680 RepID=UPI0005A67CF4|nr:hypothetical protein [Bacillus rubiinfantis]
MIQIDWRQFGRKFESLQESFEELCHYLFCRELKITGAISADHNQKGLETKPVKYKKKCYGYQSKFFDNNIDYGQIKHSIKNALEEFEGKLDYIFIYLNKGARTSCKSAKEIIAMAKKKGVEVVWKDITSIKTMLAQPSNIDIAQAFFGVGDEFKFIKESTNQDIITLLQSKEYLDLPIDSESNTYLFSSLLDIVLDDQDKISMIIGNPGSGKSICMHNFFQEYSGLNKPDEASMLNVIEKNDAIPMLINLKYCSKESLENIIRNRQNDYRLREGVYNFIYLLDGLDEISQTEVETTLHYINELVNKSNTRKVIISSRKESINRILIKSYFSNLKEYTIGELGVDDIQKYFEAKNDDRKLELFGELKTEGHLLSEIKDILLIKSLWDVIDRGNYKNCIFDILKLKVESIIDDVEHQKLLNHLNIPTPKKNEILELNKIISYEMQKHFTLNFSNKKLYEIVLNRYPRIDYKDVNQIVAYLAESFFEKNYNQEELANFSYIYQHRRFQEYFFTLKLKEEYELNPNILRELRVLSNSKFFEEFFGDMLRQEYIEKNDLGGMIELNLINVYMGKNEAWGADDPSFLHSEELTKAIAAQKIEIFESLMSEETLPIANHLSGDIENIINEIEYRNSNKRYINRLPDPIEEKISSILRNIVVCWENGKVNFSKEMVGKLNQVIKNIEQNNDKYLKHVLNAFSKELKNFLFIKLYIMGNQEVDILENNVRKHYVNDNKGYILAETEDEKIIKSFFKVILDKSSNGIVELINILNVKELVALLESFCLTDYLHYLRDERISEALSERIKQIDLDELLKNEITIAFKQYLGLVITDGEREAIDKYWDSLSEQRSIDLFTHKGYYQIYSFITVACNKYEDLIHSGFADTKVIYVELYKGYFELLENKITIGKVAKRFCACNDMLTTSKYNYYFYPFSKTWVNIFTNSLISINKLTRIKDYLFSHTDQVSKLTILCGIKDKNKDLFTKLVDISEIEEVEKKLIKNGSEFTFSIEDNVNSWFQLAYLYSEFNDSKSIDCVSKGINKGILRHGWRKDGIVDVELINSLEIMVDNNFLSKEKTRVIIQQIFRYLTFLGKITDDSGDWRAFEKLLRIASRIDIELAEEFLKTLKQEGLIFNELVTVVLIEKVYQANNLDELQRVMELYKVENTGYYGRNHESYYQEKIKVYFEVFDAGIFEDEEEKKAFEHAYLCYGNIKKFGGATEISNLDEYNRYKQLCEVYGKECNVERATTDIEHVADARSGEKSSDKELKLLLGRVEDQDTLNEVYNQMNESYRDIKTPEIWRSIVDKTYSITSSLESLFDYLKRIYYSHFYYSANSKNADYAVAHALSKIDTRQEMLNFIYKNSGHSGFSTMIRVYAINGNKEQCLNLFNRFLRFCDFLVFAE